MQASEVKTGMRVQYCDGQREFEAVTTGPARLGFHPGRRRSNYYIDLAYVSDAGELVKVAAAPLLGGVASEEEEAKIGAMEFSAASRTSRRGDLAGLGGKLTPSDLANELLGRPETIGWRPKQDSEEIAELLSKVAEVQTMLHSQIVELQEQLARAEGRIAELDAECNQAPEPAPPQPEEIPVAATVADGLPSAADLDVVAELQKAAEATAASEAAGEASNSAS